MSFYDELAKKLRALLVTNRITEPYFLKQMNLVQFMALEEIKAPLYVVDYWEARNE